MSTNPVVVLDFGSQTTQLIARRIREHHVYSEIHPFDLPLERLRALEPQAIVLSGGPSSCYDPGAPQVSPELFQLGVPILGICYGAQLLSKMLGGKVEPSAQREYGRAALRLRGASELFAGFAANDPVDVWMSHGDRIEQVAPGFTIIGESDHSPVCAIADPARRIFGVQFHPEVVHTPGGRELLGNFLFRIAGCRPTWTMASFIDEAVAAIRAQVGETATAICGLSGGVDSSVAAALVHRALGPRLRCIFVDTGLQRREEAAEVQRLFRGHFRMELTVVDATERFFRTLDGVVEPETKRKRIGREFIAVFDEEAERAVHGSSGPDASFLVQGTLYPDVIESVSHRGPSASIKTHHNVGGLPERMKLSLIEPLRELFKDEVRALGRELGLPDTLVGRHPFPGPGMAVRVLGEVTRERVATVQAADAIVEQEIRAAGLYDSLWQAFAVLLPVRSVGVMGDRRTYVEAIALRAVSSQDGMTAEWSPLPAEVLGRIATRIVNEVAGVNRVVFDITSKPPGTIEWE